MLFIILRRGCSIGANATIVCGVNIGRYAFIGAGAVIIADVPDYALMVGVPARRVGWMSRHGHRMKPGPGGIMICPEAGRRYEEEKDGFLRCLDLNEEDALRDDLRGGQVVYDEYTSKRHQR